ncbi:uncharacterized protein TNCV_1212901 [Trichonephila clavipes]|nr:uncharacterized protein TNCV_1212901 [Trichonephila clavipes]
MEFLKNREDFFKDLRLDTALNEMLCDAQEFADEIDIPANFELTQPRHRVRRRNVNFDYEAREDPIKDPILKYKTEFYFFTLDKAINALESRDNAAFSCAKSVAVFCTNADPNILPGDDLSNKHTLNHWVSQGLHRNVGASRFNGPYGRQGCVLARTVESNQGGRFDGNESVVDSFRSGAVSFITHVHAISRALFPLTSARKTSRLERELPARGQPLVHSFPLR